LEQYATEHRGMGSSLTVAVGSLGGVALPYFGGLSTTLLLIMILIFLTGAVGVFFLRETKFEEHLRYISDDLYTEEEKEKKSQKKEKRKLLFKD